MPWPRQKLHRTIHLSLTPGVAANLVPPRLARDLPRHSSTASAQALLATESSILVERIASMARHFWALGNARVDEWRQRSRSRRELLRLSDCELRDLGISPGIARAEASKVFWQK